MKRTRPLSDWLNHLDRTTPIHRRVGNDYLVIEDYGIHPVLCEPFTLDMAAILICTEGSFSVNVNMVKYEACAPCSVTMLAGQIVQFGEISDERPKIEAVFMSEKFLTELFIGSDVSEMYSQMFRNPVKPLTEQDMQVFSSYLSLMNGILEDVGNPYRLEAMRHLTLTSFYAYFFIHFDGFEVKRESRGEQIAAQFRVLLRENYQKERSVAFYADKICLTPKYLSRVVCEVSGRTASEWIDDFVITESKALLKSTDMTVQQISERLNFSSQSVFGKFFKNATGLSPKEYRNKVF